MQTGGTRDIRPNRVDRLRRWLEEQGLQHAIAVGAEPVNHLLGYWRYYGSPAAAIVSEDGELSLTVVYDEAPDAARMLPKCRSTATGFVVSA